MTRGRGRFRFRCRLCFVSARTALTAKREPPVGDVWEGDC